MERESWGVNSEFHKLAGPDVPLDHLWWNMEVVRILCVHSNAVHQLVLVGKLLVVELLFKLPRHVAIVYSFPIYAKRGTFRPSTSTYS